MCIDRVGTFSIEATDSSGSFSVGPGLGQIAATSFQTPIAAGSTWVFQAWYRDPFGPCGGGSNFSSTAQVTFQP